MIEVCMAHWFALLIATLVLEIVPFLAIMGGFFSRRKDGPGWFTAMIGIAVFSGLGGTATGVLCLVGLIGDFVRHLQS